MSPQDHKRLMKLARKAMHKGNSLVANRWLRTAGLAQKLPQPAQPQHGDQSGYVETPEIKAAREALILRLDQLIARWERETDEEEATRAQTRAEAASGTPLETS